MHIDRTHRGAISFQGTSPFSSGRGFTLLEVMVALLVLSIGLLGLAALQTTGLRFNHQSYGRTQAAFQIYDVIDRMRVNKVGTGGTAHANYDNVSLTALPTATDCVGGACTSAQLADFDIRSWKDSTSTLLPTGRGAICRGTFNATFTACTVGGSIYHVVVQWTESDVPMTFEAQTQL